MASQYAAMRYGEDGQVPDYLGFEFPSGKQPLNFADWEKQNAAALYGYGDKEPDLNRWYQEYVNKFIDTNWPAVNGMHPYLPGMLGLIDDNPTLGPLIKSRGQNINGVKYLADQDFQDIGNTGNSMNGFWKDWGAPISLALAGVGGALGAGAFGGVTEGLGAGATGAFDMAGLTGTGIPEAWGITGAGAAAPAAGVADAAWGVNPQNLTSLGQDALTLGETVTPWSEGLSNLTPEALGGGATGTGGLSLSDLSKIPTPQTGGGGSGNSLADFMQTLQQNGTMGDQGGLSQLFNGLDAKGIGGLTGIGANLLQGGAGAGTALSRLLSGEATAADYASLLGTAGATGLGVLGANQQADAYKDVANQYLGIGAPYRDRLNASYQPGFDLQASDPAFSGALTQSADAAARAVSTQGNPYGNPGAMAEIQKSVLNQTALPYLSNYRGQLGQFGGLGLNTSSAASLQNAGNSGDTYNALGFGLSGLTNPQPSLQELLKQLGGGGVMNSFKLNTGTNPP